MMKKTIETKPCASDYPSLNIQSVTQDEHSYHVNAEVKDEVSVACPRCQHQGIISLGRRNEVIMDIPVGGKPTNIKLNRRRYSCRACDHVFSEAVPNKASNHQMTTRLIHHIERECLNQTFTAVAAQVGVNDKTVRNIFNGWYKEANEKLKVELPTSLSIEAVTLIKHPRTVLFDVEQSAIVDMISTDTEESLSQYLNSCHGHDHVRWVSISMTEQYRAIVTRLLPYAALYINKQHVMDKVDEGLELARKAIRSTLTAPQRRLLLKDHVVLAKRECELSASEQQRMHDWDTHFPLITQAYELKEMLYRIWDCHVSTHTEKSDIESVKHIPWDHIPFKSDNRAQAEAAYIEWVNAVPSELMPYFGHVIETVHKWHDSIFAHFDLPATVTCASTEALKCLSNQLSLTGRGHSFEAVRARLAMWPCIKRK